MIVDMIFPESYKSHRYSGIHYSFFLDYAKLAGVKISYSKDTDKVFSSRDKLIFSVLINGQQVIFDYADSDKVDWKSDYKNIPYFKFQTTEYSNKEVFPLGPPIVSKTINKPLLNQVDTYLDLRKEFQYTPGLKVISKQSPYGNAKDRRQTVQAILIAGCQSDIQLVENQLNFWKSHEQCLIAVCVPGASNNMLDRGQMELIGLGVPTISPKINTMLPYYRMLRPNDHYIKCKDDYSDLIEIIQNLDSRHLKQISLNCRQLFDRWYSPKAYWEWIIRSIS